MSSKHSTKNYAILNNQAVKRYWEEFRKYNISLEEAHCHKNFYHPKTTREKIDIFKNNMYYEDPYARITRLIDIVETLLFTKEIEFIFKYRSDIRNEETLNDVPFHLCGLFRWMNSQNHYKFNDFKVKLNKLLFDFAQNSKTYKEFRKIVASFIAKTLSNNFIQL